MRATLQGVRAVKLVTENIARRIKGLFQWVVCMGLLTAGLLLAGCAPDNTRL
jgi:hypothetical protein